MPKQSINLAFLTMFYFCNYVIGVPETFVDSSEIRIAFFRAYCLEYLVTLIGNFYCSVVMFFCFSTKIVSFFIADGQLFEDLVMSRSATRFPRHSGAENITAQPQVFYSLLRQSRHKSSVGPSIYNILLMYLLVLVEVIPSLF